MTSSYLISGGHDPALEPDERGLGPCLFDKMKSYGEKIAQIDSVTGEKQTYSEMLLKIIRVCQNMQARGINQNDIISVCSQNIFDTCIPYLAGILIKTKVCSLDPTVNVEETAYLMKLARPTILFIDIGSIDLIEKALKIAELKPQIVVFGATERYVPFSEFSKTTGKENYFKPEPVDDIFETAVIFFSSGSTGLAKGIQGTHYGLMKTQLIYMRNHDNSILLSYTTLYWISAAMYLLISILAGGARLLVREFDPNTVLPLIEKYKVTYLFLFPYLVTQMVKFTKRQKNCNTSSLKSMVVGGGKIIEEHFEILNKILPNTVICYCYGMTENHGVAFAYDPINDVDLTKNKRTCVGRPAPGFIYKVVDDDTGKAVGPNQEGELRFKSKTVTTGYYKNEKDTVESFDDEGFFKSGDIAYYDTDNCFYVVDRIKEAMKFQAWHVIPAEIEGVLLQHPCVKEAAVFGKPHPIDGEQPMAAVVLHSNSKIKEEELIQFVNDRVADRKKLRGGLKFVEKLLYTPSGKIKRRKLRDLLIGTSI